MTLTQLAQQIEGVKPVFAESRPYTDRSNCRKAMLKNIKDNGLAADSLEVVRHGDKDFRYQPVAAKTEDGIPAALKISPAEREAAWQANPPKAAKAPAVTQEADMARKTSTTTKAPARKPVAAKITRAPSEGSRSRYDWAAAEEMAEKGKIPPALDFTAPTHARFRDALVEVVKAAKAGDTKALAAVKINPVSSSPKALDRYRKLCVKALKAKAAA